jgi:hypothetical protein
MVGLLKSVPLIVTRVPIEPEAGEKDVISGWANPPLLKPAKISTNSIFRSRYFILLMDAKFYVYFLSEG